MIQAFNHTEVGWIGIKSGGPNSTDYYYQSDEQTLITEDIQEKWEPDQPDNPKAHFCIHIKKTTLRDRPCYTKYPYVCQGNDFSVLTTLCTVLSGAPNGQHVVSLI